MSVGKNQRNLATRTTNKIQFLEDGKTMNSYKSKATEDDFDAFQVPGNYKFEGVLGSGLFGYVFQVRDMVSSRSEALKVFSFPEIEAVGIEWHRGCINGELDALVALQESGIAPVLYSYGHTKKSKDCVNAYKCDDSLYGYFTMELIDGDKLALYAGPRKTTQLTQSQCLLASIRLIEIVKTLLQSNIIHRDISPQNILISRDHKRLRLIDFGLRKQLEEKRLVPNSHLVTTPMYTAPEQIQQEISHVNTDMYKMALVIMDLFGEAVQGGATVKQVRQVNVSNIRNSQHYGGALADVVLKMGAPNPDDRATVDDIAGALEELKLISQYMAIQHKMFITKTHPILARSLSDVQWKFFETFPDFRSHDIVEKVTVGIYYNIKSSLLRDLVNGSEVRSISVLKDQEWRIQEYQDYLTAKARLDNILKVRYIVGSCAQFDNVDSVLYLQGLSQRFSQRDVFYPVFLDDLSSKLPNFRSSLTLYSGCQTSDAGEQLPVISRRVFDDGKNVNNLISIRPSDVEFAQDALSAIEPHRALPVSRAQWQDFVHAQCSAPLVPLRNQAHLGDIGNVCTSLSGSILEVFWTRGPYTSAFRRTFSQYVPANREPSMYRLDEQSPWLAPWILVPSQSHAAIVFGHDLTSISADHWKFLCAESLRICGHNGVAFFFVERAMGGRCKRYMLEGCRTLLQKSPSDFPETHVRIVDDKSSIQVVLILSFA